MKTAGDSGLTNRGSFLLVFDNVCRNSGGDGDSLVDARRLGNMMFYVIVDDVCGAVCL